MTLSVENGYRTHKYGPGIFVNEVKILLAHDLAGEISPIGTNYRDFGIRMILDIGKNFRPEYVIGGCFKRDANNEVIGWGSAFVVQDALARLGYTGMLDPDNTIPPSVLEGFVGKKFLRLSYVSGVKDSGQLRYFAWNQIATLEEGAEHLVARFRRSLERGYPRSYRPEFILDAPPAKHVTTSAEQVATEEEQDSF